MWNTDTLYGYRFIAYIVVIVILLICLCDWCNKHNRQYSVNVKKGLNDIIHEASTLSIAAKQNDNPLVAVIQNSEAMGLMKAARWLGPEEDIKRLTGVPVTETEREIKLQQGESIKNILRKCNDIVPQSRLVELAGWYPFSQGQTQNSIN
jgi:hypothetical protein